MARLVPKDVVVLNVNDPRATLPPLVASLPSILRQLNAGMAQEALRTGVGEAPPQLPIRIDLSRLPKADDLARPLAPGSLAVAAGPDGIRLVAREPFPSLLNPPRSILGIALGVLPRYLQSARESRLRGECTRNLKQIGLALHNYESAKERVPRPAICDRSGKPLLSWRVAILPYLDELALYNKFHLDEPWDSPHNRGLVQSMPSVYQRPGPPPANVGMTHYRVFRGKSTLFDPGKEVTIGDITDGTSNTIAVVERKEAVPWTKPDELDFDPDRPNPPLLYGAGSAHSGGFHAAFADGRVDFVPNTIGLKNLRASITRDGGELVDSDWFERER
jgi:prepilin-type processing-associated H-X9-DG protein